MYSIRHSEACPLCRLAWPDSQDALWFAVLPALHAGSCMSVFLSTRDLGEKVNRTAKQSFQAASGISMAQSFLGVELGPETFLCESVPSRLSSLPLFLCCPNTSRSRIISSPRAFHSIFPSRSEFPGTVEGSVTDLSLCLIPQKVFSFRSG